MHIVFYSTSNVFEAEEKINDAGLECKIVPTPVPIKHTAECALKHMMIRH